MKRTFKLIGFGILTWLIPFGISFAFYSKHGVPLIDVLFIKSIMIIVGGIVSAFLLVVYFRKVSKNYLHEGIVVGCLWLVINWILDFVILLPVAHMPISTYFMQIGMRYLMIPIMSIAMGLLLASKN